jgi:protein SCO1/2
MTRPWRLMLACVLGLLGAMPVARADLPATQGPTHGEAPLPGLGGPLELTDHRGQPFSLKQAKGEPVLLFFGFTQCGNTCPVALAQARQLLATFQPRKPPVVVFVTLDPLSDTPSVLAAYLSHFDARIIGLTGSPRQIEQAARQYGVATQGGAQRPMQSQGSPLPLAHSSRWYLLDGQQKLVRVYTLNTPVNDMVQDILQTQQRTHHPIWDQDKP